MRRFHSTTPWSYPRIELRCLSTLRVKWGVQYREPGTPPCIPCPSAKTSILGVIVQTGTLGLLGKRCKIGFFGASISLLWMRLRRAKTSPGTSPPCATSGQLARRALYVEVPRRSAGCHGTLLYVPHMGHPNKSATPNAKKTPVFQALQSPVCCRFIAMGHMWRFQAVKIRTTRRKRVRHYNEPGDCHGNRFVAPCDERICDGNERLPEGTGGH